MAVFDDSANWTLIEASFTISGRSCMARGRNAWPDSELDGRGPVPFESSSEVPISSTANHPSFRKCDVQVRSESLSLEERITTPLSHIQHLSIIAC